MIQSLSNHRAKLVLVFLYSTIFMSILQVHASGASEKKTWTVGCIDLAKNFSEMNTRYLAVDGNGHLHAAYGQDFLYYAFFDGFQWNLEIVDSDAGSGGDAAIAVDSLNRPHISYVGPQKDSLRYVYKDGGLWHKQTVATAGTNESCGNRTAIDIDSLGHPWIIFNRSDYWNSNLQIAHWDGSTWQIQTAASSALALLHPSLKLDSSDRPHISYYDSYQFEKKLRYVTWTGSSWLNEELEVSGSGYTSIYLDNQQIPHITYRKSNDELRYAHRTGGSWTLATVGSTSGHTSLIIDSSNKPHISHYYDSHAYYTTKNGSTWQSSMVDSTEDTGMCNSIALNVSGAPMILYLDTDNSLLKLARKQGATWNISTVDHGSPSDNVGQYCSLAIGVGGNPQVSYFDTYHSYLKYALWTGSEWSSYVIDTGYMTGRYTSIAVDTGNKPHIVYSGNLYQELKYAHWTGSTWAVETLSDTESGMVKSIAIDSLDLPHISYVYDSPSDKLYYMHWNGSSWLNELVDDTGNAGRVNSIAVDSLNKPHIAYRRSNTNELMHAYKNGPAWSVEFVDDRIGRELSLCIDAQNNPHIAYYNSSYNEIRYAKWTGSEWNIEIITHEQNYGWYVSLALDNQGKPHISCLENDVVAGDRLTYVTQTSKGWSIETVDANPDVGEFSSIDVNDAGDVFISYYDATNFDLKYATYNTPAPVPTLGHWTVLVLILTIGVLILKTCRS